MAEFTSLHMHKFQRKEEKDPSDYIISLENRIKDLEERIQELEDSKLEERIEQLESYTLPEELTNYQRRKRKGYIK